MEPAPERRRKTTWKEFLAQHWELIVAADFFTVEVWTASIGRNVTDAVDGILNGKRYLIHDRDPLFTIEFQNILASVGVTSVKLPPQSPNRNAYAERFVRSIKESCLDRLILFGEASLRRALPDFILHDHEERHHQGKGNQLLFPRTVLSQSPSQGIVRCQQRLGGLLKYYHQEAA